MLHTQFLTNINTSNNLKLELVKKINKLENDLEISLRKNIENNQKVKILKEDLEISLRNNDIINLEIRKLKFYNFIFKFIGGISLAVNLYYTKIN